jgi:hypothetical protein
MQKFYEISVKVDTNDADFVTLNSKISEEELEIIKPLISAIKNFKPYTTSTSALGTHRNNYPYGDCCRQDLGEKTPQEIYNFEEKVFEMFEDFCPHGGDFGFRTVESIFITPYVEKTRLL